MNVLEEALATVTGSRMDDHGHPYDNMRDAAEMWSAVLHTPVTPQQVALCMIAFKIARESNNPGRDNMVDIAGYCWVHEKCGEMEY